MRVPNIHDKGVVSLDPRDPPVAGKFSCCSTMVGSVPVQGSIRAAWYCAWDRVDPW